MLKPGMRVRIMLDEDDQAVREHLGPFNIVQFQGSRATIVGKAFETPTPNWIVKLDGYSPRVEMRGVWLVELDVVDQLGELA